MEWLTGLYQFLPPAGWGLWFLTVIAVIWMLARGHLVPGAVYRAAQAELAYRRATDIERDRQIDQVADQVEAIGESMRTTEELLRALPRPSSPSRRR